MSAKFFSSVRIVARISLATCMVVTVGLAVGCNTSKKKDDVVSGKVTMNGQPVAGQVVFVGPDNKESGSPIGPDGSYQIMNPTHGENKVMVKGMATPGGVTGGPKIDPKKQAAAGSGLPGGGSEGVAPPPKYGTAATPLKFNVTGGNQEYNIELEAGK